MMYLQYRYGYDSQTSSEFGHNCKIDQLIYKQPYEKQKGTERTYNIHDWNCTSEIEDSPGSTFFIFAKLLEHADFYHSRGRDWY